RSFARAHLRAPDRDRRPRSGGPLAAAAAPCCRPCDRAQPSRAASFPPCCLGADGGGRSPRSQCVIGYCSCGVLQVIHLVRSVLYELFAIAVLLLLLSRNLSTKACTSGAWLDGNEQ